MDRNDCVPIWMHIKDCVHTKCEAVRNIYFHNIHSRGYALPYISGRKDCYLKNIYFSDCSFEQYCVREKDMNKEYGASAKMVFGDGYNHAMQMHYTENFVLTNTTFTVHE